MTAHILGFPRIGAKRELKWGVERYWREGDSGRLDERGKMLRDRHWKLQEQAGLDFVTTGDFAWYDQVLQMSVTLSAIPERFAAEWKKAASLSGDAQIAGYRDLQFAMARGTDAHTACAMTKWFNTNYHYITPELQAKQTFQLGDRSLLNWHAEALSQGYAAKPVLVGPVTWLRSARMEASLQDRLDLLDGILQVYVELIEGFVKQAQQHGQQEPWIQIDEPCLVEDLSPAWQAALVHASETLAGRGAKLLIATYFGSLEDNLDLAANLPCNGLHVDQVHGNDSLKDLAAAFSEQEKILSCGVVNGRNIWRCDLAAQISRLEPLTQVLGENLWVGSSCSLAHSPVDLQLEEQLDPTLRNSLAFAKQKLEEVACISQGLSSDQQTRQQAQPAIDQASQALDTRRTSTQVTRKQVQERMAHFSPDEARRQQPYASRIDQQRQRLNLPDYPTTTIGSFPQTDAIRRARKQWRDGEIDDGQYQQAMRDYVQHAVEEQEGIGLDVLVHGEPERNDMVEYFGEQLDGYAFTQFGWVQSYGSRCIKPPIITGDVQRPSPMTVDWIRYAQSKTDKPMKGMLTGPITMLFWSFPREDLSIADQALQIAYALRDEIGDLEQAGTAIIQVDEPAIREGLPLRQKDHAAYFDWAIRAFRVSTCGVRDDTQIHTHMCYSEFNGILDQIAALDADVLSIETSRSNMELLKALKSVGYPQDIGPGVYDIHSPRIPEEESMLHLLQLASEHIEPQQLWVNPDCGLKTRTWDEVRPALTSMVDAAKQMRAQINRS